MFIDKNRYEEEGYLFFPNVVQGKELKELQTALYELIELSKTRTENDELFDLAPEHTMDSPSPRRIKEPYRVHPVFDRLLHSDLILDMAEALIGPNIMLEDMPLNIKTDGAQADVEWHQDWAYLPYTNDNVLAISLALTDCNEKNGALRVIPGTHRLTTPVSHHQNGAFCGSIDPNDSCVPWEKAITLIGAAGSISIHHCRTVHGSPSNKGGTMRALQLIGLCATDAWPLIRISGPDDLKPRVLRGTLMEPRLAPVPVRMPYPRPKRDGSIYQIQFDAYGQSFKNTALAAS